jgi:hypothetical protein
MFIKNTTNTTNILQPKNRAKAVKSKLLNAIYSARKNNTGDDFKFLKELSNTEIEPPQMKTILTDPDIFRTINDILKNEPRGDTYEAAVILSQIAFKDLPADLQKKINPVMVDANFTIQPGHKSFFLCADAEPLLEKTLKETGAILINKTLLMKFNGKMVALCLENTTATSGNEGTFLKGMWYILTETTLRNGVVTESFDQGDPTVHLPESTWALIRPELHSTKSKQELTQKAIVYASSLTDILPSTINGRSRKAYREYHQDQNYRGKNYRYLGPLMINLPSKQVRFDC